jgi:hypothetical protein
VAPGSTGYMQYNPVNNVATFISFYFR